MRLTHLAIVLGLFGLYGCAKKQPDAQKPVPAATAPSDPQPQAGSAPPPPVPESAAPTEAAPAGSRAPVKKGGDPQDGGQ
ncbi:MAG: hypothetical protein ABI678_07555 [Kofleriaceae bacterium]